MHRQVRACFLLKLLAFIARVVSCIAVSDFAFGRQRRLFAPPRFGTTDEKKLYHRYPTLEEAKYLRFKLVLVSILYPSLENKLIVSICLERRSFGIQIDVHVGTSRGNIGQDRKVQ